MISAQNVIIGAHGAIAAVHIAIDAAKCIAGQKLIADAHIIAAVGLPAIIIDHPPPRRPSS
jgi:hypothetical protein